MHHPRVKSNLVDTRSPEASKLDFEGNNHSPFCPKPRRPPGLAVPDEFLNPLRCGKHSQQPLADGKGGVLSMISNKTMDDGRGSKCSGCSPSCYSGSPPERTANPLVHDVEFVHQMELHSLFARTKLSDRFGFTSAS